MQESAVSDVASRSSSRQLLSNFAGSPSQLLHVSQSLMPGDGLGSAVSESMSMKPELASADLEAQRESESFAPRSGAPECQISFQIPSCTVSKDHSTKRLTCCCSKGQSVFLGHAEEKANAQSASQAVYTSTVYGLINGIVGCSISTIRVVVCHPVASSHVLWDGLTEGHVLRRLPTMISFVA